MAEQEEKKTKNNQIQKCPKRFKHQECTGETKKTMLRNTANQNKVECVWKSTSNQGGKHAETTYRETRRGGDQVARRGRSQSDQRGEQLGRDGMWNQDPGNTKKQKKTKKTTWTHNCGIVLLLQSKTSNPDWTFKGNRIPTRANQALGKKRKRNMMNLGGKQQQRMMRRWVRRAGSTLFTQLWLMII